MSLPSFPGDVAAAAFDGGGGVDSVGFETFSSLGGDGGDFSVLGEE